jgi:HEAT repeat protein
VFRLIETIKRPGSSGQMQQALEDLSARGSAIVPIVLQEMRKHDRYTFVPMLYVLGRVGDRSTREVLWDVARSETGVVRHWAHYALALQGELSAAREVVRSPSAKTSFVRGGTAADFVAGVLGPPAVDVLLEELPHRAGGGLIAGMAALGTLADPRATDFLLEQLAGDDPAAQRVALGALARIGAEEAAAPATRLLASDDFLLREAAADALSYFKWAGALAELRRVAVDDPSDSVRGKALWALGKVGGPPAAATLGSVATEDGNPEIRRVALMALGETGADEAAAPLLQVAMTPESILAPVAIGALTQLSKASADEALAKLAADGPDARVRAAAVVGLGRSAPVEASRIALQLILSDHDALSDSAPLVELIGRYGDAVTLETLEERLRSGVGLPIPMGDALNTIRTRKANGDAVPAWAAALDSDDPARVVLAATRLGEIGGAAAVSSLIDAFGRVDPQVAHEIVTALGRIGSAEALPFLNSLIADELYAVPSLEKARRAAAWSLSRVIESGDDAGGLEAMVLRGGQEAVSALVALARLEGEAALDDLYRLKKYILRRATADAVSAHESVNWLIRQIRAGRPLDRLDAPPE